MGKTALVTGGAGFVGRHVTARLLQEGISVWIVDDLSSGQHPRQWLPPDFVLEEERTMLRWRKHEQLVVFIESDAILFFAQELGLLKGAAQPLPFFDYVFHYAAVVGGRAVKIAYDPLAIGVDLAIDSLFFRWLVQVREQVRRVLYASSSAAYPAHLQEYDRAVPLKEEHVRFDAGLGMPDAIYGWSKLTGEYLARLAASHYGLQVACVRPFSGYGEDQDLNYPIPSIARRAALREDPLIVWGSGQQGRDFVHIDDAVEAMWRAIHEIADGGGVNIGSGKLMTFVEVAQLFADLAHYRPQIKPLPDKPEGTPLRVSDATLMETTLGWRPQISLAEGLQRVLNTHEAAVRQPAPAL